MTVQDYERTIILNILSHCPQCGEPQKHVLVGEEGPALLCGKCGHEYDRNESDEPITFATASPVYSKEDLLYAFEMIRQRLSEKPDDVQGPPSTGP